MNTKSEDISDSDLGRFRCVSQCMGAADNSHGHTFIHVVALLVLHLLSDQMTFSRGKNIEGNGH